MERSLGLLSRTASNTPFHNDERVVLLCWPSCTEVTRHTRVVNIRKAASATKAPPFQPGCVQTRFDLRSPVGPVGSDRTGQTGEQLVRGVTAVRRGGGQREGPGPRGGGVPGGRTDPLHCSIHKQRLPLLPTRDKGPFPRGRVLKARLLVWQAQRGPPQTRPWSP